jgi:Ca2+-binding EF-hand superfamily protein
MEGFLQSMDLNRDGIIQESEVPEERRFMFRMMSQRMGLDPDKGISIQGVRAAVESRAREQGPPGSGGAPWQPLPPPKEEPLVLGFGDDQSPQLAAAFGVRLEPTSGLRFSPEKKLDPQVEAAMRWFDRNQNGVLEREEWGRLPGNPAEIDQNGDGKITADEFAAFMAQRQRRGRQGNESRDDRGDQGEEPSVVASFVSRGEGSYRFRSAQERLPSGLPGWFGERDANRDGQISMAEYSRTWNDSTVREFARYDRNNDGVITAEEALNPLGGRSGGSTATDAPAEKAETPSGGSEKDGSSGAAPSGGAPKPWWME